MKRIGILVVLGSLVFGLGLTLGQAQQSASSSSLGELARKLREKREKSGQKATRVFTNDNLPARPASETLSVASGISTPSTPSKPGETTTKPSSGAHDEAYYRARTKELREQQALHQRELDVLEQKLGQGQTNFYSDPQKTLEQQSTPALNSDVNKLRDEIDKKKQQVADDQKAMDDLTDQLRREGGDPGWLR